MKKNPNHFISVIIPVYLQEKTICQDIYSIYDTLEQIRYDYEIIAVVDGTTTDTSFTKISKLRLKKLKVYGYPTNHGKGYALRYGMARSKGDYVAFIDAGMEIDPNGISIVLEHMEWYNADIIVASKLHPASIINYPLERKILSFLAKTLAKILFGFSINDTQTGLKIFKKRVLQKVLPRLLVKRYAFDIEILAVARHLGYRRIFEAPTKLNYGFQSLTHASSLKFIFQSLVDTLAVFYRLNILGFYNDNNRRHFKYDPELEMKINTGQ